MELLTGITVLLGLAIVGDLILTLPVMWLWNWLMPTIFGLPTISFWQAFGLSVLCSLLLQSTKSSSGDK